MQALPPGAQALRFRRPLAPGDDAAAQASAARLVAAAKAKEAKERPLIKQLINVASPPWAPSFPTAFRLLILVRFAGAMYTSISDCDETYNYWEPLHFVIHGRGFQTWEYSPLYMIRSWAYILIHALPPWIMSFVFRFDKRPAFFAVRIVLALVSTLCECRLYRSIVDHISIRAGRYFLLFVLFNAGMWNAATAFLPSTFALHLTTLATSFALEPPSGLTSRRTFLTTLCFVASALVGWPFAGLLAVPFALEELTLLGNDNHSTFAAASRFARLLRCGLLSVAAVLVPLLAVDGIAYGKLVLVPWRIVAYNVFGRGGGPNLYGTEPWTFYPLNLALNFNILLPLAVLSLPAVLLTARGEPSRLAAKTRLKEGRTSAATLLAARLAPMYIWFAAVGLQPHKEERFMFPVYILICFAAAITLTLARGWLEAAFVRVTASPYRAGRSPLFSLSTGLVILAATVFGASRILALQNYYHAPFDVMFHFQYFELPAHAITTHPSHYASLPLDHSVPLAQALDKLPEAFDFGPLGQDNVTLCWGKEWHRFPSHWLVPNAVRVGFVESGFRGILPKPFEPLAAPERGGGSARRLEGTRGGLSGFNDANREEPDRYVPLERCTYLIDSDYPSRPPGAAPGDPREPRYVLDARTWDRRFCSPLLDAAHSARLTRAAWLPGRRWQSRNAWGELCLLKRRAA